MLTAFAAAYLCTQLRSHKGVKGGSLRSTGRSSSVYAGAYAAPVTSGRKSRERRREAHTAADEAAAPEKAFPDPRLLTFPVKELDGKPVGEPTFVFPVDRLRLPDRRVLAFHQPTMPGFFLLTAKDLLDAGEREREQVLGAVRVPPDRLDYADVNVADDSAALDALGKVASAIILSATAVEAYANECVDRLKENVTVDVERRGAQQQTVPKSEMVRRLSLEEKLDLVVPKAAGVGSIKGKAAWERFKKLNELCGEVVHYKPRGQTDDPDVKSALGRLLTGEGSSCVADAAAVIVAYEPTLLPESTRRALGLAT